MIDFEIITESKQKIILENAIIFFFFYKVQYSALDKKLPGLRATRSKQYGGCCE